MLLIKAIPKPGAHGIGLFAAQDIPKGAIVWRFDAAVDSAVPAAADGDLFYGYISRQTGRLITPGVDGRHINHSGKPNLGTRYEDGVEEDINYALREIKEGEELTLDYAGFAEEGADFL
jgi:SET domain-containing protein